MTLTAEWIDGYSSDGQVLRQAQGSLIGSAGGLVAGGGLTLTQKGTPNMSVQILGGTPAEGGLWIPGYTTTTGPYYFQNSATYEQVIETAGASFPRIDTIVARIYDNAVDGLGKKEPVFEALKGAEESGVTLGNKKGAHAAVKNTYILGYVLVPAKASSIVTADIEQVAMPAYAALLPYSRTNEYSTAKFFTKAEAEAGTEASAIRPAYVLLSSIEKIANLTIVGPANTRVVGTTEAGGELGFELPPGQKWKIPSPCFMSVLLK